MKKKYIFCGFILIVVAGLLTTGISNRTTAVRSVQPIQESTPVKPSVSEESVLPLETTPSAQQKELCGCCAERKTRLEQKIKAARARRQAKRQVQTTLISR